MIGGDLDLAIKVIGGRLEFTEAPRRFKTTWSLSIIQHQILFLFENNAEILYAFIDDTRKINFYRIHYMKSLNEIH